MLYHAGGAKNVRTGYISGLCRLTKRFVQFTLCMCLFDWLVCYIVLFIIGVLLCNAHVPGVVAVHLLIIDYRHYGSALLFIYFALVCCE